MKALLILVLFALPAFAQERTLQDVARVPKAERPHGSFSATESSVKQDDTGWTSLYAANARAAEIKREVAKAYEVTQPGYVVQTYVVGGGYVGRPRYSAPQHRTHSTRKRP